MGIILQHIKEHGLFLVFEDTITIKERNKRTNKFKKALDGREKGVHKAPGAQKGKRKLIKVWKASE